MMYPLVRDLAGDGIPVTVTCRVLGFSTQSFYKWHQDPATRRDWDNAHLINAAYDLHADDPAFGYRFIADELPGRRGSRRLCPYRCVRGDRWCPDASHPIGQFDQRSAEGDLRVLPWSGGEPLNTNLYLPIDTNRSALCQAAERSSSREFSALVQLWAERDFIVPAAPDDGDASIRHHPQHRGSTEWTEQSHGLKSGRRTPGGRSDRRRPG